MAGKRLAPVFTHNFAKNLEAIRTFLGDEGRATFGHLVDRVLDDVVPTLCRFPFSGRSFLTHPIRSLEARSAASSAPCSRATTSGSSSSTSTFCCIWCDATR